MISPAQIRAARALLGWSQTQLIRAVRLTPAALSRLESGQAKGRANTLQRLENTLTQAGIEFTDGEGVKLRQKTVGLVQYDGRDAISCMQDDIYVTMMRAGARTMYLNGVDERRFMKASPASLSQIQKKIEKAGIRQKILIQDGDRYFVMPTEVASYKWISSELFGHVPTIIFDRKVAVIFWGPPTQVVVMENAALAETYLKQFNAMWRMAKAVPFTPREIRDICDQNFGLRD